MSARDNDRSPDLVDSANTTAEMFLEAELAKALGKAGPESHPDFDGSHCVGDACGAEIPAARIALGKVRCVSCQALIEERRRGYAA